MHKCVRAIISVRDVLRKLEQDTTPRVRQPTGLSQKLLQLRTRHLSPRHLFSTSLSQSKPLRHLCASAKRQGKSTAYMYGMFTSRGASDLVVPCGFVYSQSVPQLVWHWHATLRTSRKLPGNGMLLCNTPTLIYGQHITTQQMGAPLPLCGSMSSW